MQASDLSEIKSKYRIENESQKADKSNDKEKLGLIQVNFLSFYNFPILGLNLPKLEGFGGLKTFLHLTILDRTSTRPIPLSL